LAATDVGNRAKLGRGKRGVYLLSLDDLVELVVKTEAKVILIVA
jgi:hypothetical protein